MRMGVNGREGSGVLWFLVDKSLVEKKNGPADEKQRHMRQGERTRPEVHGVRLGLRDMHKWYFRL